MTFFGLSIMNGHVQCIDDKFGTHVRRHRPANNAATEDVEHDGEE